MARPSIFSSKYEVEMKKRKRRIIFTIIALVFVIGVVILTSGNIINYNKIISEIKKVSVFNSNKSSGNSSNSTKVNNNKKTNSSTNSNKKQTTKKNATTKVEDKVYSVQFVDGKAVKVFYDDSTGNKVIKTVENTDSQLDFNISPSSNLVVIYEKSTQAMMLVDSSGKATDITYPAYKSERDGTVFEKDTVLKNNAAYIWCNSPKFVDDNNIVYISQVPWFDNRPDKFLWIYSISENSYRDTNITGANIQINGLSDKGIEIVSDGNTEYLKADGTINK